MTDNFIRPLSTFLAMTICTLSATWLCAEQIGPHEINAEITPLVQKSLRQGDTTANAELDVTGYIQLRPNGEGTWEQTRLEFWVLGTDTLGGSRSTSDFSERAGLLWDTNDGDSPDPYLALAVAALAQDVRAGNAELTFKIGKLFPAEEIGTSAYYGDDRGTFFSQMLATDVAGRWADTIGLGGSLTFDTGSLFGGILVVDATAESDLLDFETLENGDFLYAGELGHRFDLFGRATEVSALPFFMDTTSDLSSEQGIALSFQHDLTPASEDLPADAVLFGRYTTRTGGDPRTSEGENLAKAVRHGGFLGVAFNRPFGQEAQQVGLATLYGAPTDMSRDRGFDVQYGLEGYWKVTPNRHTEFSLGLQAISRRDGGAEVIPGLRFKLKI